MARSDAVWNEQGTTPDAIEAALRNLLNERYSKHGGFVPARALNMVAFVERQWSGEIANRLRGVGRYHASRLIVLSYEPSQTRLDARVSVASEGDPRPGEFSLLRETVVVEIGECHLDDLLTIVDPLVVTDLPTLLWSPHGYPDAVETLLALAQAVLIDSIDEPVWREGLDRARALTDQAYVVDLAWLRSTPWRERIATAFDPEAMRSELGTISSVDIRHHPDSTVAAMLLAGWMASRLGWSLSPLVAHGDALKGQAHARRQDVALHLQAAPELQVRGLESLTLETASGLLLGWDRGPGGLHTRRRGPTSDRSHDEEREWTVLGASRGEAGILGEGIRQALLRDSTYSPSLAAAVQMVP